MIKTACFILAFSCPAKWIDGEFSLWDARRFCSSLYLNSNEWFSSGSFKVG
jgi:hypothetical protein